MYGKQPQLATPADESPLLSASETKRIQEVSGTMLYYAQCVDPTILPALGDISTQQATPTENTKKEVKQVLDYLATHPDAKIRFTPSDMVLHADSNGYRPHLSCLKARSRSVGYFYFSDYPQEKPKPSGPPPALNGAIFVACNIMREVLASAAETELGALYTNAKEACPIRIALEGIGHPQLPTILITDNSTAAGITNDSVKQKRSKAMDMRFYWLRNRVYQGQFRVHWKKEALNLADYFTKHHPASHHQQVRSVYLYDAATPTQNYFDCLKDELDLHDSSGGEGVFSSRVMSPGPDATDRDI
jgi:hypothetical protein